MAQEKKILHVSEITIDQSGDLCLNVREGFQVILGKPEQLSDKLDKASRTVEELPGFRQNGEYVDVTCPDAAAFVKMKNDNSAQ